MGKELLVSIGKIAVTKFKKPYTSPICSTSTIESFFDTFKKEEKIVDFTKEFMSKFPKSDIQRVGNAANIRINELRIAEHLQQANDMDSLLKIGINIDKLPAQKAQCFLKEYADVYNRVYSSRVARQNISAQKLLSGIFGQKYTPEEAANIIEKYKSILKEENFNEFIDKLLQQAKKDFGFETSNIRTIIYPNQQQGKLAVRMGMDVWSFLHIKQISDNNPLKRVKVFQLLMHELKHHKQHEIMLRTNAEAYIEILTRQSGYPKEKVIELLSPELKRIKEQFPPLDKNSKLYKKGLAYIENQKHYIKPDNNQGFNAYKSQLVEDEAYNVQDSAIDLFYAIKNGLL